MSSTNNELEMLVAALFGAADQEDRAVAVVVSERGGDVTVYGMCCARHASMLLSDGLDKTDDNIVTVIKNKAVRIEILAHRPN